MAPTDFRNPTTEIMNLIARHLTSNSNDDQSQTPTIFARQQTTGSSNKVADALKPNSTQLVTLYFILGYSIFIAIAWNLWGLRLVIYPFKLITVAFHEFSHAAVGCCTGARIESIEVDPNQGGLTRMRGGIQACSLPAGYLGSSLIGALLIFAGFDTVASKVASIVVAVFLLITLFWARRSILPANKNKNEQSGRWLVIVFIILWIGLMVAFWFIAHGTPLRFLILFLGVMSALYSIWDVLDDLVFRKVNESDASQFAKLCPIFPSQVWGVIWFLVALVFMAAGILGGLAAFKDSASQQQEDASHFLPTRP